MRNFKKHKRTHVDSVLSEWFTQSGHRPVQNIFKKMLRIFASHHEWNVCPRCSQDATRPKILSAKFISDIVEAAGDRVKYNK